MSRRRRRLEVGEGSVMDMRTATRQQPERRVTCRPRIRLPARPAVVREGLAALPAYTGPNDPRPADWSQGERLMYGVPAAVAIGVGVPFAVGVLFCAHAWLPLLPAWPW
jgi:hypothetical protein